jgi:putative transcriptional regulator
VEKLKVNLSTLMGKKKIRSIRQLSEDTGISRPTLARLYDEDLEMKPTLETILKLCDYFKCSLDELIEYTPNKEDAQ